MPRLRILLAWSLLAGFAAARCSGGSRRSHAKIQATLTSPTLGGASPPTLHPNTDGRDGPYLSLATTHRSSRPSPGSSAVSFLPNGYTVKSTQNPPESVGWALDGAAKSGISLGIIPDDGSGGGTRQTVAEINSMIGQRVSAQGYYAQVFAGQPFDGGQLLSKMDQIIKNGGVFQPSVMPIGGWAGLTRKDNRQAVAICKVMKRFTDLNVETWVRFAHEVNWYQRDGTYEGTVDDFKEGWSAVASACKQIAPQVKMWFTPNVATLAEYDRYYPDDHSTVDLIGIDYYPKVLSTADFVAVMKPFHDKYCTASGPFFAIAETAPGSGVGMTGRMNWLKHILSPETKAQLPYFIAVTWFNLRKTGIDYRIADSSGGANSLAVKLFLDSADE